MSFYKQRDSFGPQSNYNNYQSDSRRNSNSFNEDQEGGRLKKRRWYRRGSRGGANRDRSSGSNKNVIDTPLFKEPSTPPQRTPSGSGGRYNRSGGSRDNPFRDMHDLGSQPYFDIREMPDFIEPQHAGTPWHWDNYFHGCKAWQEKHKLAYYRSRCMALEFENQMLFEQINSLIQENCVFAVERGKTPTMRLPDIGSRQGWQTERAGQTNTQTAPKKQGKNRKTSTTSDSELEFEITEDTMNVLEKRIRHKLSLNKERSQEDGDGKDGKNKEGPKVPMGYKRKEELEKLYGDNSALIQGLETSVTLNFNRNCDTFKPDEYPAVYLNRGNVNT